MHQGFAEYALHTVDGWCAEYNLQPATEIFIGGDSGFACSSSEVINSLFENLGRAIDSEQGLKKLSIEGFDDQNVLQDWSFSQFVLKGLNLESLTLKYLGKTVAANSSQLLEFFSLLATQSSCLNALHIECTTSSGKDGDKFMQVLADSSLSSLLHLTISFEINWFVGEREECLTPMLVFLAR